MEQGRDKNEAGRRRDGKFRSRIQAKHQPTCWRRTFALTGRRSLFHLASGQTIRNPDPTSFGSARRISGRTI
eukprot:768272-Hanusia_phi.AAC.6